VVEWFADFYDALKKQNVPMYEGTLKPGELLFIPSTWWHTALNLEESIAVTQNFVSKQNLHRVLSFLQSKKNPQLYQEFTAAVEAAQPGLINATLSKHSKKKLSLWEQIMQPKTDADAPAAHFSLFS
jgi:ribosomal protein L16 Arg81 hydroxylase